ncbi:hypothetical protein AWN76_006480 [Rhodothermaceae bacterium RA]|nr:hypothetical protein AWN76_006480 [Rhodothermaceae bacterium RA]
MIVRCSKSRINGDNFRGATLDAIVKLKCDIRLILSWFVLIVIVLSKPTITLISAFFKAIWSIFRVFVCLALQLRILSFVPDFKNHIPKRRMDKLAVDFSLYWMPVKVGLFSTLGVRKFKAKLEESFHYLDKTPVFVQPRKRLNSVWNSLSIYIRKNPINQICQAA